MNRTQSVSTVMFLRVALVVLLATTVCRASQPFVIETDAAHRPAIVLPYDAAAERGFDLEDIRKLKWYSRSPLQRVREAIDYFNEAIEKMTGAPLEMRNDTDLSRGIVLTTLELASPEIREDPRVTEALAQGGENDHGANEAFYMRSASDRLLLVANTPDGLLAGVVALLESVEYEVLGMGPNWVHVPDHRDRPLTFDVERSDRPSFFLRRLWAAGAQSRGVGTINERLPLSDPRDEHVRTSYMRWLIGARLRSKSIPPFPGHAMQQFHGEVLAHMRDTGETQGFLAPVQVGPLAKQPEGSDSLAEDTIYIHTDNANTDEPAQASVWRNGEWREQRAGHVGGVSLDLSVEFVRRIVLEKMRERAEAHFASDTDELFIFGIDPEDGGGYAHFERHMANPQWYARYREQEDDPLGEPYKLHGKFGLDQPVEQWDPSVLSNHVYATADWLLREFDKSESPLLREHADRVRCSFYSYNFHDVPPTFNPNRRIRVMIADYPKHRGRGRWKELVTHIDVAKALSIMLPDAPSGDYLILSLAFFHDDTLDDLDPGWSLEPKAIHAKVVDRYEAGMRAISAETDFNFGKYGIGYYLFSKMLWNAEMSVDELAAVRDRYLRRAFGAGWEPMRRYYELFGDMPVSSPNFWARAIRLIDEADQLIDAQREPAAQRRIDDVKVYWYYYYLLDSGRADPERKQMQRFLWQGQMSYQVAMHMVLRRVWGRDYNWLNDVLPESIMEGPAHYTHEQTQRWWAEVLEHWPVTPVRDFRDGALSDGTPAAQADVHDLVLVQPFVEFDARPGLFLHNRIQSVRNPPILHAVARRAGEEVGFKLFWTATDRAARNLRAFNASASYRAVGDEQWQPIEDASMNDAMPVRVETTWRERPVFLVTVRLKAPAAGVYRFEVGRGGSGANLTSLNFELATGETSGAPVGATYSHLGSGLTQTPAYLYIPKGTRSLDLEVWDSYGKKTVTLYQGLPPGHPTPSREVDISDRGTHTVALEPEETGTIAAIRGNGFAVPYFYSVPQLWAKSPGELLVPRVIAEADGLTIVGP